jgi:hypothetical protein
MPWPGTRSQPAGGAAAISGGEGASVLTEVQGRLEQDQPGGTLRTPSRQDRGKGAAQAVPHEQHPIRTGLLGDQVQAGGEQRIGVRVQTAVLVVRAAVGPLDQEDAQTGCHAAGHHAPVGLEIPDVSPLDRRRNEQHDGAGRRRG